MDAMQFLERAAKLKPQPVYVLAGDEPFLKAQALAAIRRIVLGEADDGFAVSAHDGAKAAWAAVSDDLHTLPMLSPRRVVSVSGADPFVTRERARLEKLFAERAGMKEPTGVLVLDVNLWQATTKLAKATPDAWLVACKTPATHSLPKWAVDWCQARHGKALAANAAKLLVDLVGPRMGQLDMELEKLAVHAGDAARIELREVDQLVGSSREEKTWEVFDLIGAGKAGEALAYLRRLFDQGEEPMKLLGAFSMQLRRLGAAARLAVQGVPGADALERAGIPKYPVARQAAEMQMRHLGKARLDRLFDWLLECDQGMKGGSQLPPRLILERLVVRLARARA
ncbi:MAG: DNA polymerase III subunit delta [Gemmataceae bacterium]|nr:DNA polymerase III subunit delta [Gemmataceae bacterium]